MRRPIGRTRAHRGRLRRWAAAGVLASAGLVAPALVGRGVPQCLDDAPVCLEIVEAGATRRFVVSNASAAPYSLRVSVKRLQNMRATGATPFRAVLGPGEERVVGSIAPIDPDKATRYQFEWRAAHGDMLARPDPRWHYRMPFGGAEPRVMSQGVDGRFSHRGAGRYAFDFAMPYDTPILAARSGTVVQVRDGSRASGRSRANYDKANAVEILHADGTIATYAHLRRGASVRVGDRVETGDPIGFSGDTGYTTGPHLHFMVWRRKADLEWETLPVRFHDGTGGGFVPRRGVAYAPACPSSGAGCDLQLALPASEAPAARDPAAPGAARREGAACHCPNGAVIHVDLSCERVCGL